LDLSGHYNAKDNKNTGKREGRQRERQREERVKGATIKREFKKYFL
jgi:hypothetical protein